MLPIALADQEACSLEDQTQSTKPFFVCSFSIYFLRLLQASTTPCCSTLCLLRNSISSCRRLTVRTLLFSSEVTIMTLTLLPRCLSPTQTSVQFGRVAAVTSARWRQVKGWCVPVRPGSSWARMSGPARFWISVPSIYAAAKCVNSTRIL